MFRRRIFYNAETGAVLHSYAAEGNLNPNCAADKEAEHLNLTDWGVFQWDEPDPETEAAFLPADAEGNPRIVNVAVDVSGEAPQPSEREDMAAALALLGVEPEEGA